MMSTTWTGFEMAKKLSERPRQLRHLKNALQTLEAEIMFGLSPLSEACSTLARQLPKPISFIFERFSYYLENKEESVEKAWMKSLDENWPLTALLASEYEIMQQFGATLGQHDKVNQQKHIRLAIAHLEREEQDALEKRNRYEKMLKSLGILSGLLIILLMI